MAWGCIMRNQKGPFTVLHYPGGRGGGMDSIRYREQVLEPFLAPFYEEMKQQRRYVYFQQDNAKCHVSAATKAWLQSRNILLFPHPSKSPDFNPIEPVWFDLKNIVRNYHGFCRNSQELTNLVYTAWNSLTIDQINKHINCIPLTLDEYILREGAMTRF